MKSFTTRYYPDYWLIISGAIFIFVVLFMPDGVIGLPRQLATLYRQWSARRNRAAAAAAVI